MAFLQVEFFKFYIFLFGTIKFTNIYFKQSQNIKNICHIIFIEENLNAYKCALLYYANSQVILKYFLRLFYFIFIHFDAYTSIAFNKNYLHPFRILKE